MVWGEGEKLGKEKGPELPQGLKILATRNDCLRNSGISKDVYAHPLCGHFKWDG